MIASAVARAGDGVGVLDTRTVDRVLSAAVRPLTADQAAVVRAVASSGRGVEVVEALAGTGKTYTAGVLRELYEQAGYQVVGVAPTGRAARELTDEAGIRSRTLDRLLIDLDQLGDMLPEWCVVVFDEAGMAATRTTARLLEAAERAGAKVVAIGDPGGDRPALRGGCFVNPGRGAMWGGLVGLPVVARRGRGFAVAEVGAVSGCVGARSAPVARSSRYW